MTTEQTAQVIIETWFLANEVNLADPSYEGEPPSPEQLASLETALRQAGVNSEVVAAQGDSGEGPSSGAMTGVSAAFLGQIIGACFGRKPTLQMLLAAERLLSSPPAWAAFSAAAASEASSDRHKLIALVTCLRELVHAFTWAPRRIVHLNRDNICELVDRYRLQPRLDDLWPGRNFRAMLVRHEPAFDALRVGSPASFLGLLDEFPHPEPVRHILEYSANCMDLNGLLGMLSLAPHCFEGGTWLPWIKTPFLIVASIEAKLEALADEIEDEGTAAMDAFVTAIRQVVQGLLGRADGSCMGYAWLQRLIQRRSIAITRLPHEKRPGPEYAGRLLLSELASALPPRRDAVGWVNAEQDLWRRDRAIAAVAAAGLGETVGNDAVMAVIIRVLRLDLWATGLEDCFSTSSSPERFLLSAVIGRHFSPSTWFDALWLDLATIRDRARHETTVVGRHRGDATVIAVAWFLFGLDAIDVRTPAQCALWRSLHLAVRDCAMIQTSHQAQEAWRACYCFLAAHLAHRLSKFGDDEAPHDLRALLGPILCLDMTLAKVVVVLNDAGVSPAAISAGAARPDHLVKLLRRLQAEQVRLEAKQLEQLGRQSQFSHAIARAADAIGGVAQATS